MIKAKVLWVANLSLLLIIEIIFACMVCNPAKDFKAISSYTVVKAVSANGTSTVNAGVVGMNSVILIIFAALIILGMLKGMSMAGGENDNNN